MIKSDFTDWKRHTVTQVVFSELSARIQNLYEVLGTSAGLDPLQDREFVGAIKAYKDMIDVDFDMPEGDE